MNDNLSTKPGATQKLFSGTGICDLQLSLKWSATDSEDGRNVQLDPSCILFNHSGKITDVVFCKQLQTADMSVTHSGDQKTSEAEQILINLTKMSNNVKALVCIVTCCTEGDFSFIENAKATLSIPTSSTTIAEYSIKELATYTAFILFTIYRGEDESEWYIRSVLTPTIGRTFKDVESMMKQELSFLIPPEILDEGEVWSPGKEFKLAKRSILNIPTKMEKCNFTLSWSTKEGSPKVDLDAGCILVFWKGDTEVVSYHKPVSKCESIKLQRGDKKPDGTEEIFVDLNQVPKSVIALVFVACMYDDKVYFKNVSSVTTKLISDAQNEVICSYDESDLGDKNAFIVCKLFRKAGSITDWKVMAIGESIEGRVASMLTTHMPKYVRLFKPWVRTDVTVIEAKNLIAKDSSGFSDPYVLLKVISTSVQEFKTDSKKKTLNPVWNKTVTTHPAAAMEVHCYDKDLLRDDKMGSTCVDVLNIPLGRPVEEWFPLQCILNYSILLLTYDSDEGESAGAIKLRILKVTRD